MRRLITGRVNMSNPPPTFTNASPSSGLNTGGQNITITGTGFRAGATVTIHGISATSVNVVNDTTITCTTPSDTSTTGLVNIVITNTDAQTVTGTNAFTLILNPSTLSLTGWHLSPDYNATTGAWNGTASAGSSGDGSHDWVAGSASKPTVGAALNGYNTVNFAESGLQYLVADGTPASYFSAAACTLIVLAKISSVSTNNADYTTNAGLIVADGLAITQRSTPAVGFWNYDGTFDTAAPASFTLSQWAMFCAQHTGGNITMQVNNGTAASTASGDSSVLTGTLSLGATPMAANTTNGLIAEVMLANTALSGTVLANLKAYFNFKYALSL